MNIAWESLKPRVKRPRSPTETETAVDEEQPTKKGKNKRIFVPRPLTIQVDQRNKKAQKAGKAKGPTLTKGNGAKGRSSCRSKHYEANLRLATSVMKESKRYAPANLDIEPHLGGEGTSKKRPTKKKGKGANKGMPPFRSHSITIRELTLNPAKTKETPNRAPSAESSDEMDVDSERDNAVTKTRKWCGNQRTANGNLVNHQRHQYPIRRPKSNSARDLGGVEVTILMRRRTQKERSPLWTSERRCVAVPRQPSCFFFLIPAGSHMG